MKNNKALLIAVGGSLAVHCLFFVSSHYWTLPGMKGIREETRTLFRIKRVQEKPDIVRLFGEDRSKVPAVKMARREPDPGLRMIEGELPEGPDMSLERKKEILIADRPVWESVPEEKTSPADMLDIESGKARKETVPEKRRLVSRIISAGPESVPEAAVTGPESLDHRVEEKGFRRADVIIDTAEVPEEGFFRPGGREFAEIWEKTPAGEHEDISPFLEVEVYKYVDKKRAEKYFKLVIKAKEESELEVIPKEMIFLIDSSKSITESKLAYVRSAVIDSLRGMNPDDRFNVVAFRGELIKFREGSVRPDPENIAEAETFIKQLKAVGQTDVDNALLGIVGMPLDINPSYVMMVTDGRPTTGVTDSRRIIQEITRHNRMKRPVFSFGGGQGVNRYLLDFISYQNRAWSRFAGRKYQIREEFGKLYRQIKSPLLLNLKYRLINIDTEEVYPKYLPDLYEGSEFTLYGRFKDENVFSMQLLGRVNGETKELIFRRSIDDAKEGAEDIAREWAFRKIYYLISRDTMGLGDHTRLRLEIDELSRKYNIVTPYDIEKEGK